MTRNEKLNRKAIEYSLAIKDFMVMHGAKEESAKTIAKIMQLAYMAGAAEADANQVNLWNARKEMLDEVCEWADGLEVEEPSKDLEEAARKVGQKYFPDENNIWARPNYEAIAAANAFKEGAKWQEKQLKDK